jgi:hypothetical protein
MRFLRRRLEGQTICTICLPFETLAQQCLYLPAGFPRSLLRATGFNGMIAIHDLSFSRLPASGLPPPASGLS